ncbi:MAG: efflux RND transporter periplasmic adaptor subunit [Leptolinea sp.]|nr:efflux RND transporter periplasmic adaptor subunit [Leptolinea sp.]
MISIKQRPVVLLGILLLLVAGSVYAYNVFRSSTTNALPEGLTTTTIKRETISTRVGSTGMARPNQLISLTWETNGKVGLVNAKSLDKVRTGDILVELDPESLDISILQAMENLPSALRSLETLKISDVKRTQAREELAKAQIELDKALENREQKNQLNASETNIEAAQASYLVAKANLAAAEEFFAFLQDKPEDDLTRAQVTAQLSMARKNYDWALWNYQWAQNKPLPEDIRIADANLKVAEAKVADAEREWEKVKDNPDPDDIVSARSTVNALQSQINRAKITAPIDSVVVESRLLPGDLVTAGQTAVVLMDNSRMFLDISVSEIDINNVKPGKQVDFSFDAIPGKSYVGTVTDISTVGRIDQEIIYFTVTCEISNPDMDIKPGMTAAATIAVDEVRDVISIPNTALRASNKNYYVYMIRENALHKIPVELGLVSDLYSEMKSGDLHEGDIVVTNPQIVKNAGAGK